MFGLSYCNLGFNILWFQVQPTCCVAYICDLNLPPISAFPNFTFDAPSSVIYNLYVWPCDICFETSCRSVAVHLGKLNLKCACVTLKKHRILVHFSRGKSRAVSSIYIGGPAWTLLLYYIKS